MRKYKQTTTKISCSSDKELIEKVNRLGSAGDMPITIKSTIPDQTDTKQWYVVNYWVRE
jgi:hypothetical protein